MESIGDRVWTWKKRRALGRLVGVGTAGIGLALLTASVLVPQVASFRYLAAISGLFVILAASVASWPIRHGDPASRWQRRVFLWRVAVAVAIGATLAILFVALPFMVALQRPEDPRSGIFSSIGQASAIILTTIGLGTLAVWQTLRQLATQTQLEQERRAFDRALLERDFVEKKAVQALGDEWRDVLRTSIQGNDLDTRVSKLEKHGVTLDQVARQDATIARLLKARNQRQEREYLERNEPEEYEALLRQEQEEDAKLDRYIEESYHNNEYEESAEAPKISMVKRARQDLRRLRLWFEGS